MEHRVRNSSLTYNGSLDRSRNGCGYSVVNGSQERGFGTSLPRKNRCDCCPYGYHIDLDFIQYCESVSSGAYLKQLRKLKKYKRKQRKSLEIMLGLASEKKEFSDRELPMKFQLDELQIPKWDQLAKPGHEENGDPSPPDILSKLEVLDQALRDAVVDFEETFERSRNSSRHSTLSRRGVSAGASARGLDSGHFSETTTGGKSSREGKKLSAVDLLFGTSHGGLHVANRSSNVLTSSFLGSSPCPYDRRVPSTEIVPNHVLTRTHSTSSISSLSSVCSSVGPHGGVANASQRRDGHMDSDSVSVTSATSSVSPEALQNIREQMASSLQRIREMEDQVKTIPMLQVKLSVLKEEKRQLLLQLQAQKSKSSRLAGGECASLDETDTARAAFRSRSVSPVSRTGEGKDEQKQRNRSNSACVDGTTRDPPPRKVSLKDLRDAATSPERKVTPPPQFRHPSPPPQPQPPPPPPKSFRDASVSCKSLTRDVGTISMPPGRRSVGCSAEMTPPVDLEAKKKEVKSKPCFKCIQRTTKKFVTIACGPDAEEAGDQQAAPETPDRPKGYDSFIQQLNQSSPILARLRRASSVPPPITVDSWCQSEPEPETETECRAINTDLRYSDFLTYREHESILRESLQKPPTSDCGVQAALYDRRMTSPFALTKALQTDMCGADFDRLLSEAREVRTVEKTVAVNPDDGRTVVERADFGVTVRLEALWESMPLKRSIATGDDEPYEFSCPDCATKPVTSEVGVGDGEVPAVKEYEGVKVRRCDVGTSTELVKTTQVSHGVQTQRVPLRSIGTSSTNVTNNSVGVNTVEAFPVKKESAPTTPDVDRKAFGVSICDKCQDQIHSVAQDFVQKVDEDVLPAIPSDLDLCETASNASTSTLPPIPNSRIPRPVSLQVGHSSSPTPPRSSASHQDMQAHPHPQSHSVGSKIPQRSPSLVRKAPEIPAKLKRGRGYSPGSSGKQTPSPPARSGSLDRLASAKLAEGRARAKEKLQKESDSSPSPSKTPPSQGSAEKSPSQPTAPPGAWADKLGEAAPTAPPLDPNRKRYEVSPDMKKSLKIVSNGLKIGSNTARDSQFAKALQRVQEEWFRFSSTVEAQPDAVEAYVDACEEISKELLVKVVNLLDANGNTAMHYAVSHGNFDIVSLLLDSKVCDVNLQNKAGYTCTMLVSLAHTVLETHRQVVRRLFNMADVNIKASQHGQTALMLAVSHGRFDMVKLLMEAGADLNIQDTDGSTSLMCAAEHGHMDIVKYLLAQADCDATLLDNDGSSALQIAMDAGHKDIGVLIYHHLNFSRGSSPYSSLRVKGRGRAAGTGRSGSIPRRAAITPPPRTPPPHSPALSRKSSNTVA